VVLAESKFQFSLEVSKSDPGVLPTTTSKSRTSTADIGPMNPDDAVVVVAVWFFVVSAHLSDDICCLSSITKTLVISSLSSRALLQHQWKTLDLAM